MDPNQEVQLFIEDSLALMNACNKVWLMQIEIAFRAWGHLAESKIDASLPE